MEKVESTVTKPSKPATNEATDHEAATARLQRSRKEMDEIAALPFGEERQQRGREWMERYPDLCGVTGDFERQLRFWRAMDEVKAISKMPEGANKKWAIKTWASHYPDLLANWDANVKDAAEAQRAAREGANSVTTAP